MPFDRQLSNSEFVYLRPVAMSDVNDRYVSWLNDPIVNQYLETRFFEQSVDSVRQFVIEKTEASNEFLMAICLLESGLHIGNIKIGPINTWHSRGDLSLFVGDRTYWGRGVASLAIKLMIEEGFNHLHLNKITAGIYRNNIASQKAFERNGFLLEGLLKKHFMSEGKDSKDGKHGKDGKEDRGEKWQDANLFGLTADHFYELLKS